MSVFPVSNKNKFDIQLNFAAIWRQSAEFTKNGRFLWTKNCNNVQYRRMLVKIQSLTRNLSIQKSKHPDRNFVSYGILHIVGHNVALIGCQNLLFAFALINLHFGKCKFVLKFHFRKRNILQISHFQKCKFFFSPILRANQSTQIPATFSFPSITTVTGWLNRIWRKCFVACIVS